MGYYDNNGLFIASTYAEIAEKFKEKYNQEFGTNYDLSQLLNSNIFHSHNTNLQLTLIEELLLGLIQDNTINYLKTRNDLTNKQYGSAYTGIVNALTTLDFVEGVNVGDPNNFPEVFQPGHRGLAIKYKEGTNNQTNNQLIANILINNLAYGLVDVGDIVATASSPVSGQGYTFKWVEITPQTIKAKLFFKYDRNFYGNKILASDIAELYKTQFKLQAKVGVDLKPAQINDPSLYPSVAYLESQFSLDGTTWLDRNKIIQGAYNKYFVLDEATLTIEEDI